VVNGKAVGDEKYEYKLRWLAAVHDWVAREIAQYPNLIVLGDFNIAPDDRDVHDPAAWHEQILCSTPERDALKQLCGLGLHDSFRLHSEEAGQFSWWDYRAAGFRRNLGLRIDLILVSEALKARCRSSIIDREPRSWERPSDHAPVLIDLD
jgi:exodeoxyribonuclease-3